MNTKTAAPRLPRCGEKQSGDSIFSAVLPGQPECSQAETLAAALFQSTVIGGFSTGNVKKAHTHVGIDDNLVCPFPSWSLPGDHLGQVTMDLFQVQRITMAQSRGF